MSAEQGIKGQLLTTSRKAWTTVQREHRGAVKLGETGFEIVASINPDGRGQSEWAKRHITSIVEGLSAFTTNLETGETTKDSTQ